MCVCVISLLPLRSRAVFGMSCCNERFLEVEVGFMRVSD